MMQAVASMAEARQLGKSVQTALRGAPYPRPMRPPEERGRAAHASIRQRRQRTDWENLARVAVFLARLARRTEAGPPDVLPNFWEEEDLMQAVWQGSWQSCIEAFTVLGMVLLHKAECRRTSVQMRLFFAHRLIPTAFIAGWVQEAKQQECQEARRQAPLPFQPTQGMCSRPEEAWDQSVCWDFPPSLATLHRLARL